MDINAITDDQKAQDAKDYAAQEQKYMDDINKQLHALTAVVEDAKTQNDKHVTDESDMYYTVLHVHHTRYYTNFGGVHSRDGVTTHTSMHGHTEDESLTLWIDRHKTAYWGKGLSDAQALEKFNEMVAGWNGDNHGDTNDAIMINYYNNEQDDNKAIAAYQGDLDQLRQLAPGMSDTITALDQLVKNYSSTMKTLSKADNQTAMSQIMTKVHQILDVINDEAAAAIYRNGMKSVADDPQASSLMSQFATQALQYELDAQTTIDQVITDVDQQSEDWQKKADAGEAENNKTDFATTLNKLLGGVGAGDQVMKDAQSMVTLLGSVLDILAPLQSAANSGWNELSLQVDLLIKKCKDAMDGNGDITEVSNALIALLSLVSAIEAEYSKNKSKFDKEINDSNINSQGMQIDKTMTQGKSMLDAMDASSSANKISEIASAIMLALTVLFQQYEMTAMLLGVMILEKTGAMEKMQEAIAKGCGNNDLAGAAITSAIEAIATAGGAASIRMLTEMAMKMSAEMAVNMATKIAEKVVERIAENTAESTAKEASKEVVKEVAQQTIKTVTKKMVDAFASKSIPEMIRSIANGDIKRLMDTAIKQALEHVEENVEKLALEAGEEEGTVSEQDITKLADKCANRAVSDTLKVPEKTAESLGKSSKLSTFAKRAGAMGIYGMGTTGAPTYIAQAITKKDKKDMDDWQQILTDISQIIAQLGGMILACKIGASIDGFSNSNLISKLNNLISIGSGTASVISESGSGQASMTEAKAIQAIAKLQADIEALQLIMEQMRKKTQAEQSQMAQQIVQSNRSIQELVMHLSDFETATANAMRAQAV